MATPNRRFHIVFVIGTLIYQSVWILRLLRDAELEYDRVLTARSCYGDLAGCCWVAQ